MDKWPTWGPDFNIWFLDAAKFVKLVQGQPLLWLFNPRLKYLQVNIDTRSGNFTLKDRDGEKIDPDLVMTAIKAANERHNK